MSIKKLLDVKEIVKRAKIYLKITKDIELANLLNINHSTIAMWKVRGNIDLVSIVTLCDGVNLDWLIYGIGEMNPDEKYDRSTRNIIEMVEDMTSDERNDIFRYIQEKKLLKELLNERRNAA